MLKAPRNVVIIQALNYTEIMLVVPIRIRSKFAFKTRFDDVKRTQATFQPSLRIQDGCQNEGMRNKFEIRFTKWKLTFNPCYHTFLWCLIVKGVSDVPLERAINPYFSFSADGLPVLYWFSLCFSVLVTVERSKCYLATKISYVL